MNDPSRPKAIVFLTTRDEIWVQILSDVARKHEHLQIVLVDLASLVIPVNPPWRIPRRSGLNHEQTVSDFFWDLGIQYVNANRLVHQSIPGGEWDRSKMELSVESSLYSCFRMLRTPREIDRSVIWKSTRRRMLKKATEAFLASKQAIQIFSPERVFIINGRHYAEQAALQASITLSTKVRFLEISPHGYFNREYRPHDRVKRQTEAIEIAEKLNFEEMKKVALRWSARYQIDPTVNRFTKSTITTPMGEARTSQNFALFATSSNDEMERVEFLWNEASWSDQYESFESVWDALRQKDYVPILRVHPNLLRKNPNQVIRELNRVARLMKSNADLLCLWPNSKASIYNLFPFCEIIVAHHSTVGLEASLLGKKVVCTNSAAYDLIAEVGRIHDSRDLYKLGELKSDPAGAIKFVASQAHLDHEFKSDPAISLNGSFISQVLQSLRNGSFPLIAADKRWIIYFAVNRALCAIYSSTLNSSHASRRRLRRILEQNKIPSSGTFRT